MPAWFKLRCQAAPWDRTVLLLPRTRGLSGVTSRHLPQLCTHPDSPWWFDSTDADVGREAGPTGTASQCKSPAFCDFAPGQVFLQMHGRDGEGGRQSGSPGCCIPAAASARRAGTVALAADTSAGREGLEFGILFFWRGAVGAKSLIN